MFVHAFVAAVWLKVVSLKSVRSDGGETYTFPTTDELSVEYSSWAKCNLQPPIFLILDSLNEELANDL